MKRYFLLILMTGLSLLATAGTPLNLKMNYYDKYNGGDISPNFKQIFFPFPVLEMRNRKVEIPKRISKSPKQAQFVFPCGAKMSVTLRGKGKVQIRVWDFPAEAARLRQTATLPYPAFDGGTVILNGIRHRLGEKNNGTVCFSHASNTIGIYSSKGDGLQVTTDGQEGTEIRLQDNSVWNWKVFELFLCFELSTRHDDALIVNFTLESAPLPPLEKVQTKILVDRFGQSTQVEWAGKVKKESEFAELRKKDETYYASLPFPADQDRFGGLAGSKGKYNLKATGFFRLDRIGNRDVLVTPDGNIFFMISGAAYGMCDTITKTEGRENVYEWLPKRGEGFDSSFYIDGRHVSFYKVNLLRKYGKNFTDRDWAAMFWERMRRWGFNSFGPFNSISSENYPENASYALVVAPPAGLNLVRGIFDPYDQSRIQEVDNFLKKKLAPHVNSPWCIGYYLDNEQPFDEIIFQVPKKGKEVPAKLALCRYLKNKYKTIADFNRAWQTDFKSFSELEAAPLIVGPGESRQAMEGYFEEFLEQYFTIFTKLIRKYDPNHLLLGNRNMPHTVTSTVARIMGKYNDVISVNYYTHGLDLNYLRQISADAGNKPMILSEWSFGDKSHGLAGGVRNTKDQNERGLAYRNYLEQSASLPFMVGSVFFQCLDQPVTGRWIRGYNDERFNCGLVDVTDQPYRDFLNGVTKSNHEIYDVKLGNRRPFALEMPPYSLVGRQKARKEFMISRVLSSIKLDGSLADWPALPSQQITPNDLVDGTASTQHRAEFRACFDEKNLYFDIKVTDPTPLQNLQTGQRIWLGDCIELFFATKSPNQIGKVLPTDRQLVIACRPDSEIEYNWYNNGEKLPQHKIPIRIGKLPQSGYEVQLAIPFELLGIKPKTGLEFRFDIGFGDSENGRTRVRQFMWNGNERNARERTAYGKATLIN